MTKETSMSTIQERVAKGAAWLDEQSAGWRDAISLDRLTLYSSTQCVLGQTFGSMSDGVVVICRTENPRRGYELSDYGFNAEIPKHIVEGTPEFTQYVCDQTDELVAEWRRVIHQSLPVADHAPTRETSNV